MTRQGDFKQLVRERMARTGERYTTARAHVLGAHTQAADAPALQLGGMHDQTSALRDLLAAEGIDAPHTKLPPSEPLLLGLGGGIGAAVFTFQYKGELPHLYVETRCSPQFAYDLEFVRRAAAGLGLTLDVATGTTPKAAARVLDSALAAGRPALCLVDALALPNHAGMPQGALPWVVVVHEQRGDTVVVTDRSQVPLEMPRKTLDVARTMFVKGKGAVATLVAAPPRAARWTRESRPASATASPSWLAASCGRDSPGTSAYARWKSGSATSNAVGRMGGAPDLLPASRSPPRCDRRTGGSRPVGRGVAGFVPCTPPSCARQPSRPAMRSLQPWQRAMMRLGIRGPGCSPT